MKFLQAEMAETTKAFFFFLFKLQHRGCRIAARPTFHNHGNYYNDNSNDESSLMTVTLTLITLITLIIVRMSIFVSVMRERERRGREGQSDELPG